MTSGSIMKVESIVECSPWRLVLNTIFGLVESGGFTQVLLYVSNGKLAMLVLFLN